MEILIAGLAINAGLKLAGNEELTRPTFQETCGAAVILQNLPVRQIIMVLVLRVCANLGVREHFNNRVETSKSID